MKLPEVFATIFPIATLAFGRSMMRNVLEEFRTGVHKTRKLDRPRQKKYFKDLEVGKKLINPSVDRYHPKIIEGICMDIAARGQ